MQPSIRKNDTVVITTGKDRGKKGRVLRVIPDKNRLVVEGSNIRKRLRGPRSARAPRAG